ncbi:MULTISPECIES: TetR/AcrR family transcriptional regulator [unclassified Salinibacterium]|uniref:TetR/AcrR family transcriptional regulator n=1 Tax=unclassified Salinibacterium TaxID=2632331 RepID=UPI001423774F|nr:MULTISPECIES: TetR/AcrR family transcriptional regulator [unclassified Salinibacterium]
MRTPRRSGRPRSEASRRAVLEATAALVAEIGYDALTVESIASRAGVSRQTIYRWWSSRASILAEAVVGGALAGFEPANLPADADLRTLVTAIVEATAAPERATLVRGLAAAAAGDATDSDALYEHSTRASHAALSAAVARAQATGAAHPHLDPDATADAIIGALLYRVLVRQPLPSDYADQLLAGVLIPR